MREKCLPSRSINAIDMKNTQNTDTTKPDVRRNPQAKKDRSNVRCIADAWKIFAWNAASYLRFQGLYVLLSSCFSACALCAVMLAVQEQTLAGSLSLSGILPLAASLLLSVVSALLWKGCLFTQIRFYLAHDELPEKPFGVHGKEIWTNAVRTLAADLPFFFAFALLAAGICYCAVRFSAWAGLLFLPVVVVFAIVRTLYEQRTYAFRTAYVSSLRSVLTSDVKSFGSYFVIALLAFIPTCCVAAVALLPAALIVLSWHSNLQGMIIGDPDGMPPYVYALFVLFAAIGICIYKLAAGIRIFAFALKPLRKGK